MNIKLIFRTMGGDGDEGPGAAVQVMGPLGGQGTQVCNKQCWVSKLCTTFSYVAIKIILLKNDYHYFFSKLYLYTTFSYVAIKIILVN